MENKAICFYIAVLAGALGIAIGKIFLMFSEENALVDAILYLAGIKVGTVVWLSSNSKHDK